jgi:predicted O-methyltransferase YrrM
MNRVYEYIKYYFNARTIQKLHSPLVYTFAKEVLENHDTYYAFESIEKERRLLLQDSTNLHFKDSGAGSKRMSSNTRTIRDIAKNSLSNETQCRQMFHLARWLDAKTILELGTSLGISSLYLSSWSSNSNVHTIESVVPIVKKARECFKKFKRSNIYIHTGTFEEKLASVLTEIKKVDLAFIDGHHQGDACIKYFHQIKEFCHPDSVIIIDDIYWSKSMHDAWIELISDESISLSLDLFHYGVIFFSKHLKEKQHYKVIPKSLKPFELAW